MAIQRTILTQLKKKGFFFKQILIFGLNDITKLKYITIYIGFYLTFAEHKNDYKN